MLNIVKEDNRLIIDIREAVQKGLHPRDEVVKVVKEVAKGTVIEIHTPHRAQPLVSLMESMGLGVVVSELEPDHFRLLMVKTD